MVEAATEFRKSGFNDEDAANLALVATQYQNVADDAISAGEASNFIISQIKAFGLEANNAQHIIDALNEVSNNFAVSSSDLSNNLGKASAALATGNSSYEETLGLFTGITEITRNASRAARGLVSIQSRLTQVLDDQSSTGKALIDIYDGLGIELFDSNGQIRSLYDILTDLSKQWDGLSTNQKDYIALTQAGSNQTQNFLALMSNFETVTDATAVALNSAGSAAEENARYMESLEAKTNQLKATFQDLSNNVIENELIKSLLDLANKGLGALNTEVGTVITQFGLLSAGLTGLLGVGKYFLPLITSFVGGLGGWAVGIGAVVTGVYQLYKAWNKANPTLEETNTKITELNNQINANETRLKEINNLSWVDKSTEILNEQQALEEENEELKRQLDLLQEIKIKKSKEALSGPQVLTTGKTQYRATSVYGADQSFVISPEQIADYKEWGYTIEEVAEKATYAGDELKNKLYSNVDLLIKAMKDGSIENLKYSGIIKNETIEALTLLSENSSEYASLLEDLTSALDEYEKKIQITQQTEEAISNSVNITNEQYTSLLQTFPNLIDSITELNGQYFLEKEALHNLIITSDQYKNKRISDEYQTTLSTIENAQTRIDALKQEMMVIAELGNVEGLAYQSRKDSVAQAQQEIKSAEDTLASMLVGLTWSGIGSSGGIDSRSSPEDLALKSFQSLYKDLQHQRDMDKIDAEQYYVELEKLIANYTADATAHMKQYGLDTKTINQNMYQYEKEIYEGRKKLVEELAKKRQEDLDSQKSAYEALFSYMADNIDKEIEALNKERDSIVEYYDERIAKLQESNDEIERQIALEQKQDALARARQKKVLVYKDGRYQYIEDIDEVSAAKAELDAYEREEELRQETENLEELKEAALESIDAQIEKWEDYKNEWSSLVDEYQQEQNRLLISQELGIDLENDNWKERLGNLEKFKDDYLALIEEIQKAAEYAEALGKAQEYAGAVNPNTGESWTSGYNQGVNVNASGVNKGKVDVLGFDPNTDYSAAIKNAQQSGADQATIDRLTEERQNKIDAIYGGKDPSKKYAGGTLSAHGGISLVGENGPELRVLGHGDGIIPADITRNLWAWGSITPASVLSALSSGIMGGRDMAVTIQNLNLPGVKDGNDFVQYMKNNFWRQTVQFATT